jgi:hypothetical protein
MASEWDKKSISQLWIFVNIIWLPTDKRQMQGFDKLVCKIL